MAKKKKSAEPTARYTLVPQPTVRSMIVCVPEDLPTEVLASTRQLDRHLGVQATSCRRLWASPALRLWQRRHLIDLRPGNPAYCAGGPIQLLDLEGLRQATGMGAAMRYQHFVRVVQGTSPATPWTVFMQRHLADPDAYPKYAAKADFEGQTRILAMRMYNAAVTNPAAHLYPQEVEMLQAGHAAYCNYHALWAVCSDAVVTTDGGRIQPASDHFADRVTFLHQANRYLDGLDPAQRLLAVTL